jgi:arylsulfatase A-like enzyme
MLQNERYKYVYNTFDINELYDHDRDPHELHNVIDHPEYSATRRTLLEHLLEWMRKTDDPFYEWTTKALR